MGSGQYIIVPYTAYRGSDVGQKSPLLMTIEGCIPLLKKLLDGKYLNGQIFFFIIVVWDNRRMPCSLKMLLLYCFLLGLFP